MKHVLPLHTATGNTAYETCLLNLNFPQRVALVMVNVFLSEPCLTGPLASPGENKFTPSREAELQAHPTAGRYGLCPVALP